MRRLRTEVNERLSALRDLSVLDRQALAGRLELRRDDEAVTLVFGPDSGVALSTDTQEEPHRTIWLPREPLLGMARLKDARLRGQAVAPGVLLRAWSALTGVAEAEVERAPSEAPERPQRPDLRSDSAEKGPLVTIIGSGVSGLSAAHELIERGFRVQVVEQNVLNVEPWKTAVGGMARTPLRRLPTKRKPGPTAVTDPFRIAGDKFDGRIRVARRDAGLPGSDPRQPDLTEVAAAFAAFLAKAAASGESGGEPAAEYWTVQVIGWLGDTDDPGETRRSVADLCQALAALVPAGWTRSNYTEWSRSASRKVLAAEVGIGAQGCTYTNEAAQSVHVLWDPELRRAEDPLDRGDETHAYIELRVKQHLVPTEHGYRVFPAFYRHIFDTMRRTPLLDDLGHPTGQTAYDNLVPTGAVQMYRYRETDPKKKSQLHTFPRRPARSFEELRNILREFREMGYEDWDVALFEVRILKYLTSCPGRRKREAEGKNWKEYIGIDDFRKSPGQNGFAEALEDAPLSLLAARADEVDARTHLNTTVQLFADLGRPDRPSDQTLNGPTTGAWFTPWKRYLRHQGVRFYRGELVGLAGTGHDLQPVWKEVPVGDPGTGEFLDKADYYVHATGLYPLFRHVAGQGLQDDFATFDRWRVTAEAEVTTEMGRQGLSPGASLTADDYLRLGGVGPLAHVSWTPVGPFRVMAGVQYYFESGVRVGGEGHIYHIGAPWGLSSISQPSYWRTRMQRHEDGFVSNLSVDLCHWLNADVDGKKLNPFVCTQAELEAETWAQITRPLPPFQATHLQKPSWYAVDWHLERNAAGRIHTNVAPYLINRPADNEARPPWKRDPSAPDPDKEKGAAPGLAYRVNHGRWLIVGPHMRTRTRLTSMEACNESARHAVNAILWDTAERGGGLLGEFCPTWDPEEDEFPDLAGLRTLDERLLARGLPHMLDILRVEASIIATPKSPLRLADYVSEAWEALRKEPGFSTSSIEEWAEVSRRFVDYMQDQAGLRR